MGIPSSSAVLLCFVAGSGPQIRQDRDVTVGEYPIVLKGRRQPEEGRLPTRVRQEPGGGYGNVRLPRRRDSGQKSPGKEADEKKNIKICPAIFRGLCAQVWSFVEDPSECLRRSPGRRPRWSNSERIRVLQVERSPFLSAGRVDFKASLSSLNCVVEPGSGRSNSRPKVSVSCVCSLDCFSFFQVDSRNGAEAFVEGFTDERYRSISEELLQ